jgi:AmmeMemoRadiSam system protein A
MSTIADADRRRLIQIARDAIVAHIMDRARAEPALEGVLARRSAAFVSIHKRGELRGCIGHVKADEPLGVVIPRCAIAAASEDPRFPAVTAAELPDLEIELSLLGPFEPISGPGDIEVGRHGLVVEQGWRRGLLLPQVASEWHWSAEEFLSHTCHKAGLPFDAWKRGARMWRFEADVFGA